MRNQRSSAALAHRSDEAGVLAMAVVQSTALVISHHDVNAGDHTSALAALKSYISSPERARANLEGLDVAFHGYDHDSREVFEIPEVRAFVSRLDADFSFWLFCMNKRSLGLQALTLCFMPAYPTPEQRKKTFPEFLSALLTNCPDVG